MTLGISEIDVVANILSLQQIKVRKYLFTTNYTFLCKHVHYYFSGMFPLIIIIIIIIIIIKIINFRETLFVGPCHHGMARPQVADGGTASYMEGSSE